MGRKDSAKTEPFLKFALCGEMPYNEAMKTHVSYRLSEQAIRLLKLLAETKGISMASVLEIAIRELAKKESLK